MSVGGAVVTGALVARGKGRFSERDFNGALNDFQAVTQAPEGESPLSTAERADVLYSEACCHAVFGDFEAVQQCVRDAVMLGLDFEEALVNPDRTQFISGPQVKAQIRKFAERCATKRDREAAAGGGEGAPASGRGPLREPEKQEFVLTQSMLVDMYEKPAGDDLEVPDEELDVSMKGIAKRVGKLVGVMVLSFIVIWGGGYWLFYVGPWSRAGDLQGPLF